MSIISYLCGKMIIWKRIIIFSVEMMNEVALGIHGLSKEKLYKLSNNTIFLEHSEEIWRFFQKAHVVIGHNVKFDVKFLQSEFKQSGYDWKPKTGILYYAVFSRKVAT